MNRSRVISVLAGAVLLGGLMQSASAVVLFFDLGDQASGVQGGPLDGSNPVISVAPGQTVSLYLWAVPDADDNKVLAALGHDVVVSGTAASWVSAMQYTLDNPMMGMFNTRWNAVALAGGLNVADKLVSDQRAVFVPTQIPLIGGVGSSNLDIDLAYDPNSGAVYLGQLDLWIDAGAEFGSTAELRLAVSPLSIAHITVGTWQPEPLYFGFAAGLPEPADGSGADVGATSMVADAVIVVVAGIPGDLNGDGDVNLDDFDLFADCLNGPGNPPAGTCPPSIDADMDCDGDVDLADYGIFAESFTGSR